ncbi:hypothetical protein F4810DRAFT_662291 [Camillea tinctor]|nr:hypothetical protein F4810DRAFT_662291 [Camillea tinctor]
MPSFRPSGQWWKDHFPRRKRSSQPTTSAGNLQESFGSYEGRIGSDSVNEDPPTIVGAASERDVETTNDVNEAEQETEPQRETQVTEHPSAAHQSLETAQGADDKSPIWTQSMIRFANEKPKLYQLMKGRVEGILNLDTDNWDTWLDKKPTKSSHVWFRRCKAYLPALKDVKSVALRLSSLDPHNIAPWVTSGIFLAVELCFDSIDPSARDKAMRTILKTDIIISKWVDSEADLSRMKKRSESCKVKIEMIEQQLSTLYFDSLVLISSIYKSGNSKLSQFAASLTSEPVEWDEEYTNLEAQNSRCSEIKGQVELEVKRSDANIKVLNWIRNRSEDPEPIHQTIREKTGIDDSTSRAGNWFLETPEFTSWLEKVRRTESEKLVYWLKGSMGTGKTTLICRIISHFEESPTRGVRFIRYYCYGSGTAETAKAPKYKTILRALCCRLAWNNDGTVAKPAMDLYDNSKANLDTPLTEKRWEELFKDLIKSSPTTIILVIDALDECRFEEDYRSLLRFLWETSQKLTGLYFLISSRPHVPIWDYFSGLVQVFDVVQPQTEEDMKRFITDQINSKRSDAIWRKSIFFEDDDRRTRLESALIKSAGGMFRWVEIWLGIFFPKNKQPVELPGYADELLGDLENLQSLDKLIGGEDNESPADEKDNALKKVYSMLWNINGGKQYEALQIRAFQIVTAAFESLTPQQLLEAVLLDTDKFENYQGLTLDRLKSLYCNFLRENSEGVLDFEHLSAQVFVSEMKTSDALKFSKSENHHIPPETPIFSERESHRTMADIAIKVIERSDHQIWKAAGIRLVDWGTCAKTILDGEEHILDISKHRIYEMTASKSFGAYLFRCWIRHCQMLREEDQFPQKMSSLFQNAPPGLKGWIFTQALSRWGPRGRGYTTRCNSTLHKLSRDTLVYLASQGREAVCIDPFLCMVSFGFSPFSHDSEFRRDLLPGFDYAVTLGNLERKTPLHIACIRRDEAIAKDLLIFERTKRDSCLPLLLAEDKSHRIPISYAITGNFIETFLRYEISELSASSADDGPRYSRQLSWKYKNGVDLAFFTIEPCSDEHLGQIFKNYGMGPDQSVKAFLHKAIECQKSKVVEYLLKRGANVSASMGEIGTPLCMAADQGSLPIAELLLGHEANIDDVGVLHGTALSCAANAGNLEMVKFLLNRGAAVNITGGWLGTALATAAYRGALGIAQLLLKEGADVNAQGRTYETPLEAAVRGNRKEVVMFLIDQGADITDTALQAAIRNCNREMAELFIEKGANVNAHWDGDGTLLGLAVLAGSKDIVSLLLEKGVDINVQEGRYGTPLARAIWYKKKEVALFLIEKGADKGSLNITDQSILKRWQREEKSGEGRPES